MGISLRKTFFNGILYTGISRYLAIFISIGVGAVLARLLTPKEFGLVALVTVFTGFFNLLSDWSIGPAIVHNNNLNRSDVRSIFSFSILVGLVFSLILFLSSGLIAEFYNSIELNQVGKLLSISVFFSTIQSVPKALLNKDLKFGTIAFVSVIVQFLCGLLAIFLARNNFSYLAIVFQVILSSFLSFLIYIIIKPVIPSRIKKVGLLKIARFSIYQIGFNIINYFTRNFDNLLIGKVLGPKELGFYDKAYRLMILPISNITHVITPVILPAFSKQKLTKDEMFVAYKPLIFLLACIGFPLSIFLFYTADNIILLLYGSQWEKSIPIFEILSLSIGIQMVLTSAGSIFQALGRTDLLFFSGMIGGFFLISAGLFGVFYFKDVILTSIFISGAYFLYFISAFYILFRFGFSVSFKHVLKIIYIPFVFAILLFIGFFMINNYFNLHELSKFILFGISTLTIMLFGLIQNLIIRKQIIKIYNSLLDPINKNKNE